MLSLNTVKLSTVKNNRPTLQSTPTNFRGGVSLQKATPAKAAKSTNFSKLMLKGAEKFMGGFVNTLIFPLVLLTGGIKIAPQGKGIIGKVGQLVRGNFTKTEKYEGTTTTTYEKWHKVEEEVKTWYLNTKTTFDYETGLKVKHISRDKAPENNRTFIHTYTFDPKTGKSTGVNLAYCDENGKLLYSESGEGIAGLDQNRPQKSPDEELAEIVAGVAQIKKDFEAIKQAEAAKEAELTALTGELEKKAGLETLPDADLATRADRLEEHIKATRPSLELPDLNPKPKKTMLN